MRGDVQSLGIRRRSLHWVERCELTDLPVESCACRQHRDSPTFGPAANRTGGRKDSPVDAEDVRRFALALADSGAQLSWTGYLDELTVRFASAAGPANVRGLWSQVSNQLNREGRLTDDPAVRDCVLRPATDYPHVRRLSVPDSIREVERLIDSGGWVAGEKGLRLWMVAKRIGTVSYACVYDAMHEMNKQGRRIGTRGQFWYVQA